MRLRCGTAALERRGAPMKSPESRVSTSTKGTTCARMDSRPITRSQPPLSCRPERQKLGGVLDEPRDDPWGEDHDHQDHGDDLRHERDRLVLDRSDRLKQADRKAHDNPRGEDRRRDLERNDEGLAYKFDRCIVGHPRTFLQETPATWACCTKLDIRLPTTSCQPSTITKSRSLKGRLINTGDR